MNGVLRYQFVSVRGSEPLIAKAPIDKVAPAQAAYNWTGLYIGPYLGADWGYTNWTFTDDRGTTSPCFAGLLGGGEIGYNYETGKWVFRHRGRCGRDQCPWRATMPDRFLLQLRNQHQLACDSDCSARICLLGPAPGVLEGRSSNRAGPSRELV